MPNDTNGGMWDWIKGKGGDLAGWGGDVAGAAGGLAQSPIGMLGMLYMMGQYMNKQQDKNFGADPYQTALSDIQGKRGNIQNQLTASLQGKAPEGQVLNPQITKMRQMLQSRATTPPLTAPTVKPPARFNPEVGKGITPPVNPARSQTNALQQMLQGRKGALPATATPLTAPKVTPPARFNPYAGGGAGAGAPDAALMQNLMRLATGQGAGYQGGMGALQQSLSNRFGTRAMRQGNRAGALTPRRM